MVVIAAETQRGRLGRDGPRHGSCSSPCGPLPPSPAHGAVLATRNTKDFEGIGLELITPWQDS
jgi:hypothetical protein